MVDGGKGRKGEEAAKEGKVGVSKSNHWNGYIASNWRDTTATGERKKQKEEKRENYTEKKIIMASSLSMATILVWSFSFKFLAR